MDLLHKIRARLLIGLLITPELLPPFPFIVICRHFRYVLEVGAGLLSSRRTRPLPLGLPPKMRCILAPLRLLIRSLPLPEAHNGGGGWGAAFGAEKRELIRLLLILRQIQLFNQNLLVVLGGIKVFCATTFPIHSQFIQVTRIARRLWLLPRGRELGDREVFVPINIYANELRRLLI